MHARYADAPDRFVGWPDQAYAQRQAVMQQQQQGRAEQIRQAALDRIHPSPSPVLLVPQTPAPQQVPTPSATSFPRSGVSSLFSPDCLSLLSCCALLCQARACNASELAGIALLPILADADVDCVMKQ